MEDDANIEGNTKSYQEVQLPFVRAPPLDPVWRLPPPLPLSVWFIPIGFSATLCLKRKWDSTNPLGFSVSRKGLVRAAILELVVPLPTACRCGPPDYIMSGASLDTLPSHLTRPTFQRPARSSLLLRNDTVFPDRTARSPLPQLKPSSSSPRFRLHRSACSLLPHTGFHDSLSGSAAVMLFQAGPCLLRV